MRCTSRWQLGVLALAFSGNVFAGPFEDADTAYQRGDFIAKRRQIMDAWARYCAAAPKAAEVVDMAGRQLKTR